VPRIRDVYTMLALLERLGAEVEWTGDNAVRVHAKEITHEVDPELRTGSARRSCSPGLCSHASAAPAFRRRAAT
jgi:UDP-N-acetylglucosamine enolpyruvyl transferase